MNITPPIPKSPRKKKIPRKKKYLQHKSSDIRIPSLSEVEPMNINIQPQEEPVNGVHYYVNIRTGISRKCDDKFFHEIANEYISFIENNHKTYSYYAYPVNKGIAPSTFDRWVAGPLKSTHEFVKAILALRRGDGSIEKKLDGSFIAREQAHYCPIFKEQQERFLALAKNIPTPEVRIIEVLDFKPPEDKQ